MFRDLITKKNPQELTSLRSKLYQTIKNLPDEREVVVCLELLELIYLEVGSIKGARERIWVCVFHITDEDIISALIEMDDQGVDVRLITDEDCVYNAKSDYIKNNKFVRIIESGVDVKLTLPNPNIHMHHKYAIIDHNTLITGSYNWTKNAYEKNWENILLTNSQRMIKQFSDSFQLIWFEYMGAKL